MSRRITAGRCISTEPLDYGRDAGLLPAIARRPGRRITTSRRMTAGTLDYYQPPHDGRGAGVLPAAA